MGKSEFLKRQVICPGLSSQQIGGRVRSRTDIHPEVSTGTPNWAQRKAHVCMVEEETRGKKGEKRREARKSSYLGVGAQRGLWWEWGRGRRLKEDGTTGRKESFALAGVFTLLVLKQPWSSLSSSHRLCAALKHFSFHLAAQGKGPHLIWQVEKAIHQILVKRFFKSSKRSPELKPNAR